MSKNTKVIDKHTWVCYANQKMPGENTYACTFKDKEDDYFLQRKNRGESRTEITLPSLVPSFMGRSYVMYKLWTTRVDWRDGLPPGEI